MNETTNTSLCENPLLVIESSPHARAGITTRNIMGWVLIALLPSLFAGWRHFGLRVFAVVAACVFCCIVSEWAWQLMTRQPVTVSDLSAAVTGVLIAFNVPPTIPLWATACGSAFAIIVVKQFFGGLGRNLFNPALAARAAMLAAWPSTMSSWPDAGAVWTLNGVSSATPLSVLKRSAGYATAAVTEAVSSATGVAAEAVSSATEMAQEATAAYPSFTDFLTGNVPGCIGETSALAIAIGALVLFAKRIISWRIPVTYIATVAFLSAASGRGGGLPSGPLYEIMAGGLLLGAVFMATDYTTTPMTPKGEFIFALGCGILTSLIRTFGYYPEGTSYAILIMNLAVPFIDRQTVPRIFGERRSS